MRTIDLRTTLLAAVLGIHAAAPSVAQPTVSALQNIYSSILSGLPAYGIAQGSIFVIYGSDMGPAQLTPASSFPLNTTLGGVTIHVTGSDGKDYQAIPYYVGSTVSAAILPSATPVGDARVAVTYNGRTSSAAPLKVVRTAFGILTMDGSGSGPAAAFDARDNLLGAGNAASPGEAITLWGTGLGPAAGDETAMGGAVHDLGPSVPITVLIGGQQSALLYHGRSPYPGIDQVKVIVPEGVSGCSVGVEVQGERLTSNLATIPVAASGRVCADPPPNYRYETVPAGASAETRFYAAQQHFMTVVLDPNHAIAIRPHPGLDKNGWGSSLYLQPFLGVGANVLHGTVIKSVTASSGGIRVELSGVVSGGVAGDYGSWTADLTFAYNSGRKEITGGGSYNIALLGRLGPATGDLNLYKLVSNYLTDVPLLSGGRGNTGDILQVNVSGGTQAGLTWIPSGGSTYPQDHRNPIAVEAIGNYNQVDTAAQGYAPIAAAYKPTVRIGLSCAEQPGFRLIFGGAYNSDQSRQFWQDNVGITPLVLKSSTLTTYSCSVGFRSTALAGDR